jgi:hypothetical protein
MFNINTTLSQQLQSGAVKPNEVAIIQTTTSSGRVWEIKTLDEISKTQNLSGQILAQGAEVELILKKLANGEALPDPFKELKSLQQLRIVALKVPGMETPTHRAAIQQQLQAKATRVKETLKVIGKGTSKLKSQNKPWRLVGTHYVLTEVVLKEKSLTIEAARKFQGLWTKSDTKLSFKQWIDQEQALWKQDKTTQLEFLPWLTAKQWNIRQRDAWQKENPQETFTEAKFSQWKQSQYDPNSLIPEPLWLQKEYWKEDTEMAQKEGKSPVSFDQWQKECVEGRKNYYRDVIKKNPGLLPYNSIDDENFKILDGKMFEFENLGSHQDAIVWIAKELWLESKPINSSDSAFIHEIEYRQYLTESRSKIQSKLEIAQENLKLLQEKYHHTKSGKSGRSKKADISLQILETEKEILQLQKNLKTLALGFDAWKSNKDQALENRWKATRSPLTLDEWNAHQVLNPLVPMPFVSLDVKQRVAYEAGCDRGYLMRSGLPFSTGQEFTAHSGTGTVIFVIDSNERLYCASHLPGVFHHSSFLGDEAVMAAGELKSDASGKITQISSKSGHYRPTRQENEEMLKWFQARGVDLNQVTFSCFLHGGKESTLINAAEYLGGKDPLPKN